MVLKQIQNISRSMETKDLSKYITMNMKKIILLLLLSLTITITNAQTIRYQQSIRGGFTISANSLVDATGNAENPGVAINTAGGTSMSSYADLILPTGSTIAKAYLYVEGFTVTPITSVDFRVPGGAYTTLTSASAGFVGNPSTNVAQFIIDVTSLLPTNGYVSSVTAGGEATGAGRYAVADIGGFDASNFGYGWSLVVVYTNPSSRYRNVTIADNNAAFGCGLVGCSICSITFDVNGITVPSAGAYNAIAAFTGTYGDVTLNDQVLFGKAGTTLTNLVDPTINTATASTPTYDLYNSTIGICANNNVTIDAGLIGSPIPMSGNMTSRNPYNTFHNPTTSSTLKGVAKNKWFSYYYDADIIDASGILPNSATPINVTFTQTSNNGDCLGGGAYVVSVDIVSAVITKTLSPATIQDGGTATYTWTIDNSTAGGLNQAGIGFTDNLPANIIVATPPNATITGGATGTITAVAGSSSVSLSGLSLTAGQTATMTVNVTNKPGKLNSDCSTNPLAFTNGFTNVIGTTSNLSNSVTNQCLKVVLTLSVDMTKFTVHKDKNTAVLDWSTASEKNNASYNIERSGDGINFSSVGSIKGNGNSVVFRNYTFTDVNPISGMNYYRLKLIDNNGGIEYSKILSMDITKFLTHITVSPQPVKNIATITLNVNADCNVNSAVYDVIGRKVVQLEDTHLIEGENTMSIDSSILGDGVYYLIITNGDGISEKIKLIK